MRVIGLTGGIATGKSAVSQILLNLGVPVIDADQLARQVVEPGQPALQEIVTHFGPQILKEDGSLDRQGMADIIFTNAEARKLLENITHPRIMQEVWKKIAHYRSLGQKLVVFDAPLLIEANLHNKVDEVWLVTCSKETQVERLMNKAQYDEEKAVRQIETQMPLAQKRKYADIIIENTGSLSDLEQKVVALWQDAMLK